MNSKANLYPLTLLSLLLLAGSTRLVVADPAPPPPPAPPVMVLEGVVGDYLSGQFARSSGDIDQAIAYFRRIHRADPSNADITGQLQGMLLLQGKIDEAITLAEGIKRPADRDALSTLLVTLKEIKGNRFAAASGKLDEKVETDNQLWQPLLGAWLDWGEKRLLKPVTMEELGIDVGRAAPLVNYHLALINARAGFKDAAALNFKAAVPNVKEPSSRVMKALLKFYDENGQPPALASLVKTYRDANPEAPSGPEAANIVTVQDGVSEVLFTMGSIMLGAGVTNDAAIYLQLALYIKPDFGQAGLALGDAYNDLQQYSRANQFYAKIDAKDPLYDKALMHMAVNYDRMGRLSEAVALLDRAIARRPKDVDLVVAKGDLYRIHLRYADAAQVYTQALALIPALKSSYWPVLFARGSCYERQGKWLEAEKDLRQALVLKPDQPDVLNYLGYGLLERGQSLVEASMMIEKAVVARPDDAQIVDSMGWSLYLRGDYAKATAYLEKAVELMPGDPTVNDHLGDVYWRIGRKTEARFQWERALSFSPEPPLADSIRRKLKEGLPPTTVADSPERTIPTVDLTSY